MMLGQSSVRLQGAGGLRRDSPPQSSLQTAGVSDVGKIRTKLTNLTCDFASNWTFTADADVLL